MYYNTEFPLTEIEAYKEKIFGKIKCEKIINI